MKRNGGANREEPLTEPHFPLAQPPTPPRPWQRLWRSQLFRLALYYVALITIAGLLIHEFPLVRRALITPSIPVIGEGAALIMGQDRKSVV